jgi:hypothetical protein
LKVLRKILNIPPNIKLNFVDDLIPWVKRKHGKDGDAALR